MQCLTYNKVDILWTCKKAMWSAYYVLKIRSNTHGTGALENYGNNFSRNIEKSLNITNYSRYNNKAYQGLRAWSIISITTLNKLF